MNERITKLARQAGFNDFPNDENGVWITDGYRNEELENFAALIRQDEAQACAKHYLEIMRDAVEQAVLREREACAKLCEKSEYWEGVVAKCFANAIRAMGER